MNFWEEGIAGLWGGKVQNKALVVTSTSALFVEGLRVWGIRGSGIRGLRFRGWRVEGFRVKGVFRIGPQGRISHGFRHMLLFRLFRPSYLEYSALPQEL